MDQMKESQVTIVVSFNKEILHFLKSLPIKKTNKVLPCADIAPLCSESLESLFGSIAFVRSEIL